MLGKQQGIAGGRRWGFSGSRVGVVSGKGQGPESTNTATKLNQTVGGLSKVSGNAQQVTIRRVAMKYVWHIQGRGKGKVATWA